MDMNRTFFLRKEDKNLAWKLIDAKGQVLGRLSTQIADMLRGKDKAVYTPHADSGNYVVVINAEKVKLTGDKLDKKVYDRYTGWMGGYKITTAKEMLKKNPTELIKHAVKGMLPKNKLNRSVLRKLKIYSGPEHPHKAQIS